MDKRRLEQLASEFRSALEDVVENRQYGKLTIFRSFPKGCCTYTSDLLAEYLIANGISMDRIQQVRGETKEEDYSHCWLMVDNVVFVDITADQFNGKSYFKEYEPIKPCCIVKKNTYLYQRFDKRTIKCSTEVGIDTYRNNSEDLREVYNAVIRRLKSDLSRG